MSSTWFFFFSFKIVILSSHTFKHCELKIKLHIACSKLFKFERNQKDIRIPEAIDFFKNWFTNKPNFRRTWEHTRNCASQEAQIPWKSSKFSKVILKNYILHQHLITNDHKEPYSKFVPHKNSSPTKSKVFFLKLKIFPIISVILPQRLMLKQKSYTRLLTITRAKIYQPHKQTKMTVWKKTEWMTEITE